MTPLETLRAGAAILAPTLTPHGFEFRIRESGRGSGGDFAEGEFVRDDRRLEFHFQWSLGIVIYHVGSDLVPHEDYMRALGVLAGENRYPGFSDDPLDAFRDLAHDIVSHCGEFLSGDAAVIRRIAPALAARRAAQWRETDAGYLGDTKKRSEALECFRRGEYERVVALLDSLHDAGLLPPSEQKKLEIARRRVAAVHRILGSLAIAFCLALPVFAVSARAQSVSATASTTLLQHVAGRYPVLAVTFYGTDSALVEVEDASRTVAAVRARTWMFGPPVSAEEADGCPPQKVLGRRIARALWRAQGKAVGISQVIVRVHGSAGLDQMSYEDMYYGVPDLDGVWIGDRP